MVRKYSSQGQIIAVVVASLVFGVVRGISQGPLQHARITLWPLLEYAFVMAMIVLPIALGIWGRIAFSRGIAIFFALISAPMLPMLFRFGVSEGAATLYGFVVGYFVAFLPKPRWEPRLWWWQCRTHLQRVERYLTETRQGRRRLEARWQLAALVGLALIVGILQSLAPPTGTPGARRAFTAPQWFGLLAVGLGGFAGAALGIHCFGRLLALVFGPVGSLLMARVCGYPPETYAGFLAGGFVLAILVVLQDGAERPWRPRRLRRRLPEEDGFWRGIDSLEKRIKIPTLSELRFLQWRERAPSPYRLSARGQIIAIAIIALCVGLLRAWAGNPAEHRMPNYGAPRVDPILTFPLLLIGIISGFTACWFAGVLFFGRLVGFLLGIAGALIPLQFLTWDGRQAAFLLGVVFAVAFTLKLDPVPWVDRWRWRIREERKST